MAKAVLCHGSTRRSLASTTVASKMQLNLENKLVIVTGGSTGIGRAICIQYAAEGANVVCVDIDKEQGQETLAACDELSGDIMFISADMCDNRAPKAVVEEAIEWQNGHPVGVLVNNVGVQTDNGQPVHLLDESVWDQVMNINLKSYFLMSKYALPSMLSAGEGVIVNMASVQGHQSQVGIPAYASSKGGILSLTRQMAMDYSSAGVRCVSVSPGSIRTPLVESVVEADPVQYPDGCEGLGRQYPIGTMGDPKDIANLTVWLSSDMARNITGADVLCDGGVMAMGGWNYNIGYKSYTN